MQEILDRPVANAEMLIRRPAADVFEAFVNPAGLVQSKSKMTSRVVKAITLDNVTLLYTDFQGTTVDDSGETIEHRSKAIELLRRQPDGTWKLIVGDPNAREGDVS
jgi:ketosteroid isomerase-like protein